MDSLYPIYQRPNTLMNVNSETKSGTGRMDFTFCTVQNRLFTYVFNSPLNSWRQINTVCPRIHCHLHYKLYFVSVTTIDYYVALPCAAK